MATDHKSTSRRAAASQATLDPARARRALRDTFMASQGRQYVQVSLIDAVVRGWREDRLAVDPLLLDCAEARGKMAETVLPRGHAQITPVERVQGQFVLWWEIMCRIVQYVYDRDCTHIPTRSQLDAMVARVGGEDYTPGFVEEERAAIQVMFDRYRRHDPCAGLTSVAVIGDIVLPALIQGDRYWVAEPTRHRPGTILTSPHESMLRKLMIDSVRKRDLGRRLTDCERVHARTCDVLVELQENDPEYRSLPNYRKLIDEYNAMHPDTPVSGLHPGCR